MIINNQAIVDSLLLLSSNKITIAVITVIIILIIEMILKILTGSIVITIKEKYDLFT